jgi:hypothetical protein
MATMAVTGVGVMAVVMMAMVMTTAAAGVEVVEVAVVVKEVAVVVKEVVVEGPEEGVEAEVMAAEVMEAEEMAEEATVGAELSSPARACPLSPHHPQPSWLGTPQQSPSRCGIRLGNA